MDALMRPPHLFALAFALAMTLSIVSVDGGGVPDLLPAEDWVTVRAPGTDIVQFIQGLPHDPSPLGLRSAHLRTKSYRTPFYGT